MGRGVEMPRKAREKSRTGIYHVILQGINPQIIFEDNEIICLKLLDTLKELEPVMSIAITGNAIEVAT